MWLKVHHPLAFYAASLAKLGDDKKTVEYKRPRLLQDARKKGIEILPPHLTISEANWVSDPAHNAVRAGFMQIPGIAQATTAAILNQRRDEPFENWADLIKVKGIGPKGMEKIRGFCENGDPFGLDLVGRVLQKYRKNIRAGSGDWAGLPVATHTSDTIPRSGEHDCVWMGLVRSINYQNYVENQRTRTGEEEKDIIARMRDPHLVDSCVLRCYDDGDEDVYVRFNRWEFPKFRKALEGISVNSDIIIVRGRKREDFGISLHSSAMVVLDATGD